jgi:vacuolar-type H+-ATPase subunit I/STV1
MDIFMKVLGLLIGLFFAFVGFRFLFFPKAIINGIQKYKYKTTATPRKQEMVMARIIGAMLLAIGLYYSVIAVSALISLF